MDCRAHNPWVSGPDSPCKRTCGLCTPTKVVASAAPESPEAFCKKSDGSKFANQCVLDMFAADPNQNICGPCGCSRCALVKPAPLPSCTPGKSEFTAKTLVKMDNAQEKFGECHDDIASISSTFKNLKRVTVVVVAATDNMSKIMKSVNKVSDKIIKPYPVGLGIADTLGKIPKVGIFIKMGLKTAGTVIDALDPLAATIAEHSKRVQRAVNVTAKIFKGMKRVSQPTNLYLKGSHKILEAAHNCGLATGYQCGTKSAAMESKNKEDWPTASRLDDIAQAGAVCHNVLSPIDLVLESLTQIAEAIKALFEPILEVLRKVAAFVAEVDRKIDAFMKMIGDSDEAQCALEIFEPVSDTINLLTCPIDEVAGFIMHHLIDGLMGSVENLINTAVLVGVNTAVEAIIPDNLFVHIPDFTAVIPINFWVDTCEVAAVAFPEYATAVSTISSLPLPMTFTGREMKNSILTKALAGINLNAATKDYNSACVEAWNDFGTDFEHCQKVVEKIANALVDANCEASSLLHKTNMAALDAQQSVYNAALEHFEDAQEEFAKAQETLAGVYNDLDSTFDDLEKEKANCPQCRCGGCGNDMECHLEGVWCCPAVHGCLSALWIAQGGVELAMGAVDAASAVVGTAQGAYSAMARDLEFEKENLKLMQRNAQISADAMTLICKPTTYHVVKSGDCKSNGFEYITDRKECILGGRMLGVTWPEDPTASGNRQKWCGTFGGMTHLHFNSQTSGVLNGFSILQTAGKHSGQDSWQICKGTATTAAPITIVTSAPLPACKCADNWYSFESGCENQSGCPAQPCDGWGRRWCIVENPGCLEEELEDGGQWAYCAPTNDNGYERLAGNHVCKPEGGRAGTPTEVATSATQCQNMCLPFVWCMAVTYFPATGTCMMFGECDHQEATNVVGETYFWTRRAGGPLGECPETHPHIATSNSVEPGKICWKTDKGCDGECSCSGWCLLPQFAQENPGGHLNNCPGNICAGPTRRLETRVAFNDQNAELIAPLEG